MSAYWFVRRPVVLLTVLAGLALARPALAGPPLLCHPFDIGDARSLPWDGSAGWRDGRDDYNAANVVADTEALLTPSTPIIVRMETLRRAVVYAAKDREIAKRLFARMTERARQPNGSPDALTLLDAAYVTNALEQIGLRDVIGDADGYALVKQSVALRPDDPTMAFAAALIALDRHREASPAHATRARAGAAQDALLARNLGHLGQLGT